MLKTIKLGAVVCITAIALMGCLVVNDNPPVEEEPLTWNYYWDALELPEAYQEGAIFLYDGTTPEQVIRGVENGIYTATTAGAGVTATNASYVSRPDVFNATLPSTIEFRINVKECVQPRCLLFILQQQGVGELGFEFKASNSVCLLYGSSFIEPYHDEQGWSTFRILTHVNTNAETESADLYYLDETGQWVYGMTASLYANTKMPGTRFRIGDLGDGWGGTWSEDYVCWINGEASLGELVQAE